jgi:hypothetical protein
MSDLSEEIQEIKEELQQVKERNRELEQKIEQQESGKTETAEEKRNISRRKFLKMAGLGAGAIGLSSATSAWSILQPSGQGTSDIDADTVDGSGAAGLIQASEADDGGDITQYGVAGMDNDTLVNVSGSGVLLGGIAGLNEGDAVNSPTSQAVTITIDGGTSFAATSYSTNMDDGMGIAFIPPAKFESSLKITTSSPINNSGGATVWVKQ